jgi:hypothetical protein
VVLSTSFVNIELSLVDEGAMASSSSPMDAYLERHRHLVLQAEQLATAAVREAKGMPAVLPGQQGHTRKSASALTARRKLMEMSKVIASIERLKQQNLCEPSTYVSFNLNRCFMDWVDSQRIKY